MHSKIKYYGKKMSLYPLIGPLIINGWRIYKQNFKKSNSPREVISIQTSPDNNEEAIRFMENIKISFPVALREIQKEINEIKKRLDKIENGDKR